MRSRSMIAFAACVLASLFVVGEAKADHHHHDDEKMFFQADKLGDLDVLNAEDQKLGSLDNLIIDPQTGQVLYGVLDTGVFGKTIAVPWSALRLDKQEDQFVLRLNISQEKLAGAPTFSEEPMDNLADEQWRQSVNQFFGVRTAARPIQQEQQK